MIKRQYKATICFNFINAPTETLLQIMQKTPGFYLGEKEEGESGEK
jgi:hypothetical protein